MSYDFGKKIKAREYIQDKWNLNKYRKVLNQFFPIKHKSNISINCLYSEIITL